MRAHTFARSRESLGVRMHMFAHANVGVGAAGGRVEVMNQLLRNEACGGA